MYVISLSLSLSLSGTVIFGRNISDYIFLIVYVFDSRSFFRVYEQSLSLPASLAQRGIIAKLCAPCPSTNYTKKWSLTAARPKSRLCFPVWRPRVFAEGQGFICFLHKATVWRTQEQNTQNYFRFYRPFFSQKKYIGQLRLLLQQINARYYI